MPEAHYGFNRNSPAGFRLGRLLEEGENFLNHAVSERGTMMALLGTNDGSQDAHYQPFVDVYGFSSIIEAHNAWLEFDSAYNKFAVDGNVSGVMSALRQLFSKLRS